MAKPTKSDVLTCMRDTSSQIEFAYFLALAWIHADDKQAEKLQKEFQDVYEKFEARLVRTEINKEGLDDEVE